MPFKIDKSWTLFLDRDGVINERIWGGYVTRPEAFKFLPHVEEAIASFNNLFYKVVVVTNQQCIGKGIIEERNLLEVHDYMQQELAKVGGHIDHYFYAPELASNPNNTRKPKPSMAYQAKSKFSEIDFEKSIMVGDTDTDIQFGQYLGMKTVRIETKAEENTKADINFSSLWNFAKALELANI